MLHQACIHEGREMTKPDFDELVDLILQMIKSRITSFRSGLSMYIMSILIRMFGKQNSDVVEYGKMDCTDIYLYYTKYGLL